jgi:hypothetical protein
MCLHDNFSFAGVHWDGALSTCAVMKYGNNNNAPLQVERKLIDTHNTSFSNFCPSGSIAGNQPAARDPPKMEKTSVSSNRT